MKKQSDDLEKSMHEPDGYVGDDASRVIECRSEKDETSVVMILLEQQKSFEAAS